MAESVRAAIDAALAADGVAILPPMEARDALSLLKINGCRASCVMLDPWYNKGVGGVDPDYESFIGKLLGLAADCGDHVYLWGFPEIVATLLPHVPQELRLVAWLTWYYKNNPSVIRGWRSAQMTCLHLACEGAQLYPEHFLNERQLEKQRQGKLRYMPGPPSVLEGDLDEEPLSPPDVIESPLIIGFIGKQEQTGHPSQKPVKVYLPLVRMVCQPGDVLIDPMAGSGTTGAAARLNGQKAILSDGSEEYTAMMEQRLGVTRLAL
jgi:hypothetical protein